MHEAVPIPLAADFIEASAVLDRSPKASAALSRRCLQSVLHHMGFKKKDLAAEIDEAIASPGFPSNITDLVHSIRHLGNVAAHPKKEHASGAIVDVEPGEAEWLLDLLSELFDHYFVKPAKHAARKAELQKKLDGMKAPASSAGGSTPSAAATAPSVPPP